MGFIASFGSQWNMCLAKGVKSKYNEKLHDIDRSNWWESVDNANNTLEKQSFEF